MRRTIRSMGVVFLALLGVIGLAVGSAFSAALAFGAIGLFVPGTGTPDANGVANYLSNARDRYTQNTPCNDAANCTPVGINYPASFFPLVIFPGWCRSGPDGCDKWNDSVGKGTAALDTALAPYLSETSTDQVTLFGYSQGGAVISDELQNIAALKAAGTIDQSVLNRLHVVTIGGIENPDGGLWQRLAFLPTIPFFDISFGPAMKTDNGFDTTAIGFEYDPVTYAPRYWGNPLALLNAVAALETVHGYYLAPDGNGPTETLPYGYTPTTLATQLDCSASPANCRYGSSGETTYIMIPATSLPIFDFITGLLPAPLKPIVQPFVNLLTPVTKLLIDLGYDWSGDPDQPTPLSILPFNPFTFNPVDFSVKFVQAIGQGIQDAINGGPTTAVTPATTAVTPATTAVTPVTPVTPVVASALVAKAVVPQVAATVVDKTTPVVVTTDATTDPVVVKTDAKAGTDGQGTTQTATDQTTTDQTTTDQTATDQTAADKAAAKKAAATEAKAEKLAAKEVVKEAKEVAKAAAETAKETAAANNGAPTTPGADSDKTGTPAADPPKQAAAA